MVTNPEEEPTEPTAAERGARSVIAGHPQGAVRRIVLYLVAVTGLALASTVGLETLGLFVGLIALMLLAATDRLA